MNIFVLDTDPAICAKLHCNAHVVSQQKESAQILCSAINLHTGEAVAPYATVNPPNHPCINWARESIENFMWVADLGLRLCDEYEYRYGKQAQVRKPSAIRILQDAGLPPTLKSVILWCLNNCPRFPHVPMTPHCLCMPDYCVQDDLPVQSYINCYIDKFEHGQKMQYTGRPTPDWLEV